MTTEEITKYIFLKDTDPHGDVACYTLGYECAKIMGLKVKVNNKNKKYAK